MFSRTLSVLQSKVHSKVNTRFRSACSALSAPPTEWCEHKSIREGATSDPGSGCRLRGFSSLSPSFSLSPPPPLRITTNYINLSFFFPRSHHSKIEIFISSYFLAFFFFLPFLSYVASFLRVVSTLTYYHFLFSAFLLLLPLSTKPLSFYLFLLSVSYNPLISLLSLCQTSKFSVSCNPLNWHFSPSLPSPLLQFISFNVHPSLSLLSFIAQRGVGNDSRDRFM